MREHLETAITIAQIEPSEALDWFKTSLSFTVNTFFNENLNQKKKVLENSSVVNDCNRKESEKYSKRDKDNNVLLKVKQKPENERKQQQKINSGFTAGPNASEFIKEFKIFVIQPMSHKAKTQKFFFA